MAFNLYAYVGGDPLGYVDPEGLEKIILLPETDPSYPAALNVLDDPNLCTVISHGNSRSVNGMNAPQLNNFLKKRCKPDQPVKLDACKAGDGPKSIGAQLAALRKTPVTAPDERSWTTPWNTNIARPYPPVSLDKESFWNTIPDWRNPGNWVEFKP